MAVIEDENSNESENKSTVRYILRVMIINPQMKKDYTMAKADKFASEELSLCEMRELILSSFPDDIPHPCEDKLEFGYIEPGHGLKGKKEWILDEKDLKQFLEKYRSKKMKEFTVWCHSQGTKDGKTSKKSKSSTDSSKRPSRYDAHTAKMSKVDDLYKKIDEKHGAAFSPEQKRAWAHMMELGRHDSIDCPPKKRFFKSQTASESIPNGQSLYSSPGRRVKVRSECIDQLQKWHSLFDSGAITKEQYDELQCKILSDIKQL